MIRNPFLLFGSWALLLGGVLFYVLSIAGVFWPKPSPPADVGVYTVTVLLVGFGAGGLLLRWARLHPASME